MPLVILLEEVAIGQRGKVIEDLIALCGEGMRIATFDKMRAFENWPGWQYAW